MKLKKLSSTSFNILGIYLCFQSFNLQLQQISVYFLMTQQDASFTKFMLNSNYYFFVHLLIINLLLINNGTKPEKKSYIFNFPSSSQFPPEEAGEAEASR